MDQGDINKISGAIEALLFVYGEPMEIRKIAQVLELEPEFLKPALDNLDQELKNDGRGLYLVLSESKVQLATKPDFAPFAEKLVKEEYEENLTPAALETLSLVAYLGPVPRAQIDYFRGVNSSYTLRNLMMRGMIEKSSDSKHVNVPHYQASFDLLKHLGVSRIEELPDYEKFKEIMPKEA